jgi:hypothetical protein
MSVALWSVAERRAASIARAGARAVVALAAILSLAATGSVAAHGGLHAARAPRASGDVSLHGCWLSAAFVPVSAETLRASFGPALVLTQTFYGPEPLAGVWGLACARARIEEKRVDGVILSLVGAPTGLTADGAVPLANNFAHALRRADTNSPALAKALRRAGLPGRVAKDARYRHSSHETVPSTGELVVPGKYRIEVAAGDLDPTNPHDHVNSFSSVGKTGRVAAMGLFTDDAFDRFCFPSFGSCSVSVRAHRRSPVRGLLGDGSAVARAGFDHAKIGRVALVLR